MQEDEGVLKQEITIVNRLGLHARAAAKLVNLASRFTCDIRIQRGERVVNGKSIMGVMMLAASKGTRIELHCAGDDAQLALEHLLELINQRFGEQD